MATQCTREPFKTWTNTIDIRSLSRVLHVDTDKRVALVEPNVPMDKLVAATLPHDLIPPVVTGLPSLTAGSAYTDTSGASSSFRHRFFDRTVNRIEIVSANGQVMRALGWFEKDSSNSIDGDLQGLENIKRYLFE